MNVSRKWPMKAWMTAYLFVLPSIAMTLLFEYFPMFDGIYHSFYRWDGANLESFIGFDNFVRIFQDPTFYVSLQNMLFFLVFGLILMFPTIVACIVLFRIKSSRLQYMYRVLFCVPMIVPGIVSLLIWKFMYNPQIGFFNQLLTFIGLDDYAQLWLGDPVLAKWCILLMGFPFIQTIAALIYLGGLQSVDSHIWDAADIDGAGPIKRMIHVELPLMKGQFKLNLIGVLAGTVTGYGTQLVLTNGGPGFSTLVPGLYMYQRAFGGKTEFGYASAVGLVLFVISLLISIIAFKYIRSDD
ncbi:carbohydrate ABC transporter permease [Paenibacillus silvisoli]|uniref:carbohydrate ABC transporter permease n=1 Tax=Paenibacillus silvisoli TaxID=3110539 RepID=UPI0028061426|nr:sugar ABC transporter permease [Paenibacillus silvisoli]